MGDNVPIEPSKDPFAVDVLTDEVNLGAGQKPVHVPIFKIGIGPENELPENVSEANPVPVMSTASDIDRNSKLQESIDAMVIQMKILNKYMAEGFDKEITEEDTS